MRGKVKSPDIDMLLDYQFWKENDQCSCLNPLQPGVAYLYPLKTSENL